MSAFLGPIHYWLYHKIQFQEQLTKALLQGEETVLSSVDSLCGVVESKPLEEVIDTGNIHGWLQGQILIAESRYANAVAGLLNENNLTLEEIRKKVLNFGMEHPLKGTNAADVYKELQDLLLDGMPCDHVNLLVEQQENKVIFKRTADLHSSHWNNIGLEGNIYYLLRNSLLEGMLYHSSISYREEEDLNIIFQ